MHRKGPGLMVRAAIASVAAITLTAASPTSGKAPPATEPRVNCDLGRSVLQGWLTEAASKGDMYIDPAPVRHARPSPTQPASPLTRLWADARESSLFVACPQLKELVPAPLLATDRRRALVKDAGSGSTIALYGFSAPVVDDEGTEGVMQVEWICSGLCGGGQAWSYQRTSEGWVRGSAVAGWFS